MPRILLADSSAHAQRMGERILREEGFEVVTVTDGETALLRIPDVDPDLLLAAVGLPSRSGLDLCRFLKSRPATKDIGVVLTAGLSEEFAEAEALDAGSDAFLHKPFEPSALLQAVRPLMERANLLRGGSAGRKPAALTVVPTGLADSEIERVRAAVTMALDAAMPSIIDRLTEHVLVALRR